MQTKVHYNKLKLRNPFGIHHGNYNYRYQVTVEIVAQDIHGFGETVAIDYYNITPEALKQDSERVKEHIKSVSEHITTHDFYQLLIDIIPNSPFVRCAFDQAFHSLKSKISNKSLSQFLELKEPNNAISSITIGLSDSDDLINQRLNEAWPFYKLKVKGSLPYELINSLNSLNKSWGIDANGSFSVGQAQKVLAEVETLGGVYAEQLCPKNDWEGLSENKTSIPHLADESVTDLASAKRIINHFDGFVLKLTKCGGITPTLELIDFAKKNNKKLLAGCMTESSIGINNMLAISTPFDYMDLDGAFLISNDEEVSHAEKKGLKRLQIDGRFY